MTVCLAAICAGGRIVGASDRMLTASDIEFEPPTSKLWGLTSSIVAMTAGDNTLQTAILQSVEIIVKARVVSGPTNWWHVRDVVELYTERFREISRTSAEDAILAPLGMDLDSFAANQSHMEPGVVNRLVGDLTNYQLPEVQAIFAGVDMHGPPSPTGEQPHYSHLYVTRGGNALCYDTVGFAAIGIGDWHAQSQFMFAKHTRHRPFPETLLLAYSAKKHAEVAPGVGRETDMFSVGPALGSYFSIGQHVITGLEKIYQNSRKEISKVTDRTEKNARGFIDEITNKTPEDKTQSPAPKPKDPPTPEPPKHDPKSPLPSPE